MSSPYHKPGVMIQPSTRRDRRPTDILLNVLVTLLAPMFLAAAEGDLVFARIAALETITEYRAHSQASLLRVAKIIAFGIATLGSLSLSMQDDLPIPLVLRLRGNANALDRSAERNERALRATRPVGAPEAAEPPLQSALTQSAATQPAAARHSPAQTAAAQLAAAQLAPAQLAPAQLAPAQLAPAQHAPAQHAAAQSGATRYSPVQPAPQAEQSNEQVYRRMWAAAMAEVAAEETAALHTLPPAQRKDMTTRIAALTNTADKLMSDSAARSPEPGAPAWMTQPAGR
jgi:hypothetical protein